MDLETHIKVVQNLRFPFQGQVIRIIWHIATEHHNEITLEDFLNSVFPPRPPFKTPVKPLP